MAEMSSADLPHLNFATGQNIAAFLGSALTGELYDDQRIIRTAPRHGTPASANRDRI